MASKQKMILYHTALFFYILIIFISIPYIPVLTKTVSGMFGKNIFGWVVVSLIAGIYLTTFLFLKNRRDNPHLEVQGSLFWVSIIAVLYLLLAGLLWRQAVETVHLMEYGLLSWLLFQVLRFHVRDVSLFVRAAAIVLFIGTLDEIIQWFTPGRMWGAHDIWMNFLAGALIQIGLWKGLWQVGSGKRISPESITAVSAWLIASLLLLGLCMSNTQSRFSYYKNQVSFLSNFHEERGMVQDYGHIINDPEIGIFYSRFTREELESIDKYSAKITRKPLVLSGLSPPEFRNLLDAYSPRTFPFLRELKLHAILRDGNFDLASKAGAGRRQGFLTAAYRENQILLKYYGDTLRRTVYIWPRGRAVKIENRIKPKERYESPANTRLVTEFSEKGIWTAIFLVIAAIIGFNMAFRKGYPVANDE